MNRCMNALTQIAEMVSENSVRYVPAQESFGRPAPIVKIETGFEEMTREFAARVCDAAAALGVGVDVVLAKVRYARGTISEGISYIATVTQR